MIMVYVFKSFCNNLLLNKKNKFFYVSKKYDALRFLDRMEEEIVVDDVDENSSTEAPQSDDPTTPVMPLLYIQQSKLRSVPPTTTNQTLVSPNATQLAAIINPVNNQVN